jgi:heterodisulfide reductase subunit B
MSDARRAELPLQTERILKPEERIPNIPEALFLFRSCTGSLEYPGTESAIRETFKLLGIEAVMDPDQTCCSGYVQACSVCEPEVCMAVTARNLAIVERKGLDTYTFCNGCYTCLSDVTHLLLNRPELFAMANELIRQWGYRYEGRTTIYHVQEMWYRLKDKIAERVKRPLKGLRVAAHYGCHYLSRQYGILDDGDYPTFHEELIEVLGGTPVFYKERRQCCGYSTGKAFTHREVLVQPHLYKKFKSAAEAGIQLMTTVCPGCNVALDREQPLVNKRYGAEFNIPVIDLAQLIAFSLGIPVSKLGFAANTISPDQVLEKLDTTKEIDR